MVFKVKSSMEILLSAILTEIHSFSNMMKPNLCKNDILLGSPPKRAKWEGKSSFFGKKDSILLQIGQLDRLFNQEEIGQPLLL